MTTTACEKCGKEVACDDHPREDTRHVCRACVLAWFEAATAAHSQIQPVALLKDETVYWGVRYGYNDPRSPFSTFCDRVGKDDAGICWRYHMTGCPVDAKDLRDITGRKEPHDVYDYST